MRKNRYKQRQDKYKTQKKCTKNEKKKAVLSQRLPRDAPYLYNKKIPK